MKRENLSLEQIFLKLTTSEPVGTEDAIVDPTDAEPVSDPEIPHPGSGEGSK